MSAYSKDTRPFESSHLPRRVFIDFRSLSYFYKKEQTEVSFKWRKGKEQTIGTVTCIHSYGSETTLHHTLRQQDPETSSSMYSGKYSCVSALSYIG